MSRLVLFIASIAISFAVGVGVALASGGGSWYAHSVGSGDHHVCNQDNSSEPNPVTGGPFATKTDCDNSIGGGGNDGPIAGWPAYTGNPSGTFQCTANGIILTSTDDANGFGAYDFGNTGVTFENLPDGGDFSVLSGSIGAGSPRISVFLANGDEWFVYQYDVNGPGTRYEDATNNPGVYITWTAAMAIDGTQAVTDSILVVDNGDLSIDVPGLACGGNTATMRPPNEMFLCYSTFQTDGGMVTTAAKAEELLASTTDHYFLPNAVLGNVTGGTNIGPYHLVCNAPGTPTGMYLGGDNNALQLITAAQAAAALAGGNPAYYPIVK